MSERKPLEEMFSVVGKYIHEKAVAFEKPLWDRENASEFMALVHTDDANPIGAGFPFWNDLRERHARIGRTCSHIGESVLMECLRREMNSQLSSYLEGESEDGYARGV